MIDRKRVGQLALVGVTLFVRPVAAQSTESTVTEGLIWGLNSKLIYAAVPITVLVEGILIYTVWKYRNADEAQPTMENRRLEITWTIATALILLFVGVASFQVLSSPYVSATSKQAVDLSGEPTEIEVSAQKYAWSFAYTVDAEGVSGSGLRLSNVTLRDANATSVTAEGIEVRDARLSGSEIQRGRLVNGTVTGVENTTADDGSFEGVTVESATITDATIRNGTVTSAGTLRLPTDRDVVLNITSEDWLHAFHVPALGLKQDAFPGEWNQLITRAREPGTYQLYCAEYCGQGHSQMLGTVEVVSQEEYRTFLVDSWLEDHRSS